MGSWLRWSEEQAEIEVGEQQAGITEFFVIKPHRNTYLGFIESEQEHHNGLQATCPDLGE